MNNDYQNNLYSSILFINYIYLIFYFYFNKININNLFIAIKDNKQEYYQN